MLRPCHSSADRVRGVLDNDEVVAISQLGQGVHVHRTSGKMDGHDRLGPRSDGGLDGIEVDQSGIRHGVDEHRRGAGMLDRIRRGHERHRRNQHLVPVTDIQDLEREDQRGRARGHAAAVGHVQYLASCCSKRWTFGPVPTQPERMESTTSAISCLADDRAAEDEKGVPHLCVFLAVRPPLRGGYPPPSLPLFGAFAPTHCRWYR